MGKAILEGNPDIDRHLYFDDSFGLSDFYQLYRKIRREKYDYVLDFMTNPRSALFSLFSGAREKITFESRRRLFYSKVVPRGSDQIYIVEQKLGLLKAIDLVPQTHKLTMPWTCEDMTPLKELIGAREDFALSKIRIIMSPTHRRERRRWPKGHYAVLADYLHRQWNATMTTTGVDR